MPLEIPKGESKNPLLERVLQSSARKKIVVAGPGTGKTFLFKELLRAKKQKALVLTFINSLVEDLALELFGLADVRTLHSLARSVLSKASDTVDVPVFRSLAPIIQHDMRLLRNTDANFEKIFHEMDESNPHIQFYKERQTYYAHHGFADLVFDAVKLLREDNNHHLIPKYDQVFVDEFQDFNELEVRLIEILALKNPILLAGDDDQALYFRKQASTRHIRNRFHGIHPGYEPFTLDLCCRCTKVVVDAFNDVVQMATESGFLVDRVAKNMAYMDDETKNKDCAAYPKIIYRSGWYASALPSVIGWELEKIAKQVRDKFSVLLIAPSHFCPQIAEGLRKKGYANIEYFDDEQIEEVQLIDALEILSETHNNKNNLGWRIVCQKLLNEDEFLRALKQADGVLKRNFIDCVDGATKKRVRSLIALYRKLKDSRESIDEAAITALLKQLNISANVTAREDLLDKLATRSRQRPAAGLKNIHLKISTITKSKGLSEDFVFVLHFDDRSFLEPGGKLSDQKICSFLVALTRAKKQVVLISCADGTPTFLKWIQPQRIEFIRKVSA